MRFFPPAWISSHVDSDLEGFDLRCLSDTRKVDMQHRTLHSKGTHPVWLLPALILHSFFSLAIHHCCAWVSSGATSSSLSVVAMLMTHQVFQVQVVVNWLCCVHRAHIHQSTYLMDGRRHLQPHSMSSNLVTSINWHQFLVSCTRFLWLSMPTSDSRINWSHPTPATQALVQDLLILCRRNRITNSYLKGLVKKM